MSRWVVFALTFCVIAGSLWPLALFSYFPVRLVFLVVAVVNPILFFWVRTNRPRFHRSMGIITYGTAVFSLIVFFLFSRMVARPEEYFPNIVADSAPNTKDLLSPIFGCVFYFFFVLSPLIKLCFGRSEAELVGDVDKINDDVSLENKTD